jgi:hypothetical protein
MIRLRMRIGTEPVNSASARVSGTATIKPISANRRRAST